MSVEEKNDIATLTCNIMKESSEQPTSMLKEINAAREELGEEKYLLSSDEISQAIYFNICEDLVLNNPGYNKILEEKITLAQEKYKEEVEAAESKWTEAVKKIIDKREIPFAFINAAYDEDRRELQVDYVCSEDVEGFIVNMKINLKNGESIEFDNTIGFCYGDFYEMKFYDFVTTESQREYFLDNKNKITNTFETITLEITGTYENSLKNLSYSQKKDLNVANYPPLGASHRVSSSLFVYKIFPKD